MECTNPIDVGRSSCVPCGRCIACRVNRTREWAVRMLHEMGSYEESIFLTLTYSPECVPLDYGLRKVDLQLFFKRLRKELSKNGRGIKYYACGEYGDLGGRPHYHAIIFGLSRTDRDCIQGCWPFGFSYVGTVTYDSCRYVAGYIQKKYGGQLAVTTYGTRERPFQLQSKGIGKNWAIENKEKFLKDLHIRYQGKEMCVPRYYMKLFKDEVKDRMLDIVIESEAKQRSEERLAQWDERGIGDESKAEYYRSLREQNAEEHRTRLERRRRKL